MYTTVLTVNMIFLVLMLLLSCGASSDGSADNARVEPLEVAQPLERTSDELTSFTLVNHLVPCDGQTYHDSWLNSTGHPVAVRKVEMFEGANFESSVNDVAFKIGRLPDDMIVGTYPRDAYEGSGRDCAPHVTDFGVDFMTIEPGGGLVAHQFCSNIRNSPEMLFTATIWISQ